jgi:hypothetical protein
MFQPSNSFTRVYTIPVPASPSIPSVASSHKVVEAFASKLERASCNFVSSPHLYEKKCGLVLKEAEVMVEESYGFCATNVKPGL